MLACNEQWWMFDRYPFLCHLTPTDLSLYGPIYISFPWTCFHQFQLLYPLLLLFLICSRGKQVRLPCRMKRVTCSVFIYLVFCWYCMWWHIDIVSFVKSNIYSDVSLLLANHEKCLRICVVFASFTSFPFSTLPTVFICDTLTLAKAHVATPFRTWPLTL